METLREKRLSLRLPDYEADLYIQWYKDSLEWIFNDIINSEATSVECIEKYLQDLINK